jgi:hypothetical protein
MRRGSFDVECGDVASPLLFFPPLKKKKKTRAALKTTPHSKVVIVRFPSVKVGGDAAVPRATFIEVH